MWTGNGKTLNAAKNYQRIKDNAENNQGYGAILSHVTRRFPLTTSKSLSGKLSSFRRASNAELLKNKNNQ